jgi:hypothetical protein
LAGESTLIRLFNHMADVDNGPPVALDLLHSNGKAVMHVRVLNCESEKAAAEEDSADVLG